jgi:hypothetical protein
MTAAVTHSLVSAVVDDGVAGEVGPDEWNDDHVISGENLTKSDDTNVTITLNGTPTGALLEPVQLAMGWSGNLAIGRGGTGAATKAAAFDALSPMTTQGDLIYGGASGTGTRLALGAVGTILGMPVGATIPTWTATPAISNNLVVGAASLISSGTIRLQVVGGTIVPSVAITSLVDLTATFTPSTTNRSDRGLRVNTFIQPSADNAPSEHMGLYFQVTHDVGAFTTGSLYGLYGEASQVVGSSTAAEVTGAYLNSFTNGGTTTLARGLRAGIEVLSGTITTGVGVDVALTRSGGTFTTAIGLRINAAVGTIGTDIAIQSLGGQNRFVGQAKFGADSAPAHAVDVAGTQLITDTRTSTATLAAGLTVTGTRTNNTGTAQGAIHVDMVFNGGGDDPGGMFLRPTFTPSGNIVTAFGGSLAGFWNNASGITISNAVAFRAIVVKSAGTGTITTAVGLRVDTPSVSTGTITTRYGIFIQDQGAGSNAVGLHIAAMTGATNNWDMSFGRVDTTAAGAYYGRIPVLYNGLTKYVHVFSA